MTDARRPVRVPEVVFGVLLVAGSALAAVVWQHSNDRAVTIVVAATAIDRGAVIDAADLRGARVAGDTTGLIVGDAAAAMIGKVAAVRIDAGTPLSSSLVTADQPLGAGEALTSLAVDVGAMPPDLARGDAVRVVVTHRVAGGEDAAALLDGTFEVWSVDQRSDAAPAVVTLGGPVSLAVDTVGATALRVARVG